MHCLVPVSAGITRDRAPSLFHSMSDLNPLLALDAMRFPGACSFPSSVPSSSWSLRLCVRRVAASSTLPVNLLCRSLSHICHSPAASLSKPQIQPFFLHAPHPPPSPGHLSLLSVLPIATGVSLPNSVCLASRVIF